MRSNKKPNFERPATVIGKDTILETSVLQSKSTVQINGILKGDVKVEASVVVGQSGKVTGNTEASFILVAGEINGNVNAKQQLHVTKSATINGDIVCASIVIDDGAVLNGSCQMISLPGKKNNNKTDKAEA